MAKEKKKTKVQSKQGFSLPVKQMTYEEAVKAMQEDSNRTLLPKFIHETIRRPKRKKT